MTDNTKQELPKSVMRQVWNWGHICRAAGMANAVSPHESNPLQDAIRSYGNQREQEGIKKCRDILAKDWHPSMERAIAKMDALLTPEPPKRTPLETGIASLEGALARPLQSGEMCYTPALSESELAAILEKLSPAPSTLSAEVTEQDVKSLRESMGLPTRSLRVRIQEILDMDIDDLRAAYSEIKPQHTFVDLPADYMRCALIRKVLEGKWVSR